MLQSMSKYSLLFHGFLVGGILVGSAPIFAADVGRAELTGPLSQRFASAASDEIPDFQKHIVPLMGRLGCNGRACHGSFQGRGDFQLSLFGYDFKTDHQALLDESTGRVDLDDIDESLILVKPTDAEQHEGGKRFDKESWQHHVLRRWIETGAEFRQNRVQTLQRLEVVPAEIEFDSADDTVSLSVVAHWEDGTKEDVTELCRFHTNNDGIATIDEDGLVTAAQRGDTHVIVTYDNAVVPVQVIRQFENNSSLAESQSTHPIDQIVQTKFDKLRITPSGLCSDAEFVRRVSFDISGILPSTQTVREFLSDESPDKRTRLIDRLLESPGYSAWWATRFSDWTGNNEEQLNNALPVRGAASRLWYHWLRKRVADNVPYDEIVEGIVTAQSRQRDETYLAYCEAMTQACKPGNEDLFAARDGLPMFWSRKNFQKPEDRAIGFAYTFLGVRIECAQCHKHPFDRWSKEDFQGFSKLFSPIRSNPNAVSPEAKKDRMELINTITDGAELKGGKLRRTIYTAARKGQVVPFAELLINTRAITARARKQAKKQGRNAPMRIPSGKILGELTKLSLNSDTRPALMEWLRSPDNPYFAKAIVNRVWSNYFGVGIVDPTDDMNLANPPSNTALLEHLATEFINNDYDLKWLHRWIVTSETYQRSAETNETNVSDRTNFSRHVPRRLPAEVLYDATVLATGSDRQVAQLRSQLDSMAIANGKARQRNKNDFALTVFGQSIRESNCDCDRSDSPSLLQSIYLRNDKDIHARLTDHDGWVAQACAAMGVDGPKSKSDANDSVSQRKANSIRKQFMIRAARFREQPEDRQAKQMPHMKQNYNRIGKRLKVLGFRIPKLEQLIANENAWTQLQIRNVAKTAAATTTVEQIVRESYLRTLSRYPDAEESEISVAFINESKTPADGVESLIWALVNTKEFIITH